MSGNELTLDGLTAILREAAGEVEPLVQGQDILDVTFADLGYDSLALLESGGRIERQFGIELSDSAVVDADTPRALLAVVNEHLAQDRLAS